MGLRQVETWIFAQVRSKLVTELTTTYLGRAIFIDGDQDDADRLDAEIKENLQPPRPTLGLS